MIGEDRRATVHDVLTIGKRMWVVSGVFWGALAQEDLIGLRSYDRSDGSAYGETRAEYMVPEAIIRAGIKSGAIILHAAKDPRP